MSWQDELRKLDSALVAGELTADEYRQRRDRVMIEASGQNQGGQQATPAQPVPPNAMESTQIVAPISGGFPVPPQQQPQQPPQQQPPAPQQPQPPKQADATERTQVVPNQQPPQQPPGNDASERTQVVPGSAMGAPAPTGDAGERTQIVPGRSMNTGQNTGPQGVPQQGMGGQPHFPPPQPRPAWETSRPQQNQGQSPPPWMNDDGLPPDFGSAQSWPRQGPEIFTESGGGGNGKKIAIIAAVVVLLAAGVVAFFLFKPGGSDTADPGPQNPPASSTTTPTSTGPKLPKGPFVELDGQELDNQNITIDTAVAGKVPTESEGAFLKAQGVTNLGMYVTKEDTLVRAVWAFTPAAGADPKVLLTAVDGYFATNAHTELTGLPEGVLGRTLPAPAPSQGASFRGFYVASGVVLQIEAYGPDQAVAKEAFDKIVADQVKKFPPAA